MPACDTLYPALHKLEHEGWIRAEWQTSGNNRRARLYSLTRLGRARLAKEAAEWQRLSSAITHVIQLQEG
jgi:PadR family transcriptional regulator, regulatory protein PadR